MASFCSLVTRGAGDRLDALGRVLPTCAATSSLRLPGAALMRTRLIFDVLCRMRSWAPRVVNAMNVDPAALSAVAELGDADDAHLHRFGQLRDRCCRPPRASPSWPGLVDDDLVVRARRSALGQAVRVERRGAEPVPGEGGRPVARDRLAVAADQHAVAADVGLRLCHAWDLPHLRHQRGVDRRPLGVTVVLDLRRAPHDCVGSLVHVGEQVVERGLQGVAEHHRARRGTRCRARRRATCRRDGACGPTGT